MEITGLAGVVTSVAETGTKRDIGIAVLKKTMDLAASTAATLIDAIPTANLPSNLGNNVNTKA